MRRESLSNGCCSYNNKKTDFHKVTEGSLLRTTLPGANRISQAPILRLQQGVCESGAFGVHRD